MKMRVVETALGVVPISGHLSGSGPVVLGLSGAYAAPHSLSGLSAHLPEADVVLGRLPGNHSPWLKTNDFASICAAYAEVARTLERPLILLGASVGALVALGLKAANVAAVIALDPPLRTVKLWPLRALYQARYTTAHAPEREFLWDVLGITDSRAVDRDYTPLMVSRGAPTKVFLGGVPLYPERSFDSLPSLVDWPERELLASAGVSVTTIADVGHDIHGVAPGPVLEALRRAVSAFS